MRRLALAAVGMAAVTVVVTQAASAVASAGPISKTVRWPSHVVLAEPPRQGIGNQVIDPATGTDFALASVHGGASWRIRRTVLASGRVKLGPTFPVGSIGLAAGSAWVYGAEAGARGAVSFKLYQVNPRTLAVIRSRTLASARNTVGFMGLAPDGSADIAVGFMRSIFILNEKTGAKVGSITVRRGLLVSDVAVWGRSLYVAANGRDGGSAVLEYDARTLRPVASNDRRPLTSSVGGARLTAAPGGVWVTFRTGMLGQTVLLRQRGLGLVALPGAGTAGYLFAFAMSESTEFAGASLFVAKLGGEVGCVNPATGRIRARGSVPALSSSGGELVGSARGGRVLYGVSQPGVIAISPPSACR